MYYVYVLKSLKDCKLYTGYTTDIDSRCQEHFDGLVNATKNRQPLKLVYYQAFISKVDAQNEEKYLKGGSNARNALKLRISDSLKI